VIVIEYVPGVALDATVNVAVELPAPPVTVVGLNPTVTPLGRFDADSATADEKPPSAEIEIVEFPLPPCITVNDPGFAAIVKSGVCVCVPASAFTSAGVGLPQPVTRSYPATAE
jgi:hypothetical protein